MTQRTRYFVRYYRETIGKKQFDSAADAVAFAVDMKKANRLVDVGQQSTETVAIDVIQGHAVKELKGNK